MVRVRVMVMVMVRVRVRRLVADGVDVLDGVVPGEEIDDG